MSGILDDMSEEFAGSLLRRGAPQLPHPRDQRACGSGGFRRYITRSHHSVLSQRRRASLAIFAACRRLRRLAQFIADVQIIG
jgi:hypothetical protein